MYNNLMAETLYKANPNTILRTHKLSESLNAIPNLDESLKKYLYVISQNAATYVSNPSTSEGEGTSHQDLGLNYYTHGTSPIRRYVDIINQLNMIRLLNNQEFISPDTYNLQGVNQFQKHLRKFYNYYKKLKFIFQEPENSLYTAYITRIKDLKITVFIPSLDMEHSFLIISRKLLDSNKVVQESDSININSVNFKLYDKIQIEITPLKYEEKFNKKLNIKVMEPSFPIY